MRQFAVLGLFFLALSSHLMGKEVLVWTPEQEHVVVDVPAEVTVSAIKEQLEVALQLPIEQQVLIHEGRILHNNETLSGDKTVEVWLHRDLSGLQARSSSDRDYYRALSQSEKEDIHYILTTLANKPLASLISYRSSLNKAGERVDHVHPLRFLTHVFTDEELKVCIAVIKDRSWVWGEFIDGMGDSLQKEADCHNMKEEHVHDFAAAVKVEPALIVPHVQKTQWSKFVKTLIAYVPREGNPNRYDM